MVEKNLQAKITRYLKNRWEGKSAAIELKITNKGALPFNAVKDHQIAGLSIAKHGILPYKLPDTDSTRRFGFVESFSLRA